MRSAIAISLVLVLVGGCATPGSSLDDIGGETGESADGSIDDTTDTEGGEGEADGTESLLGMSCTPALGDCSPGVPCCSSDPAALDLDDLGAMVLPAYEGFGIGGGLPLFADANNAASRRGICVDEGDVPTADQLAGAPGCPRPCNPKWSEAQVAEVCGADFTCCQDVRLDVDDCVFDPGLGDAGCWRAVTGFDIVGLGGIDATEWGPFDHASHQDPGLAADGACETVIAGLPPEVDVAAFRAACRRRLTVADQRGICLPAAGVACPYQAPSYVDACERLNMTAALTGC